jgi:hypothetical protein
VLVSQGVHIIRGVRNQLLYSLMSDVFLLAKEEARYRQPTDVQKPKASYAAVLTGRCTGAETVACRCSNTYIRELVASSLSVASALLHELALLALLAPPPVRLLDVLVVSPNQITCPK